MMSTFFTQKMAFKMQCYVKQVNFISYSRYVESKFQCNHMNKKLFFSTSKYSKSKGPQLHPYRTEIICTSMVLLCTFSGTLVYYILNSKNQYEATVTNIGKPDVGGSWSLVDQDGIPRTSADYLGKFKLLYFGFTHCPDICPNELAKIGDVMNQLEAKGLSKHVVPIFITIDPTRDSVGQLRDYGADFHKSMIYLTGAPEQIGRALRLYRVYSHKPYDLETTQEDSEEMDEEYLVDHSIAIYLMSPSNEFLEYYPKRTENIDIVNKIEKFINDWHEQQLQIKQLLDKDVDIATTVDK